MTKQNTSCIHRIKNLQMFIVLLLTLASQLSNANTLVTDQDFISKNLGSIIEYLEDSNKELDLEQAKQSSWKPIKDGNFSEGFTDSQFWFRFNINNQADTTQHYVLEIGHPFLDTLDIIYERNGIHLLTEELGDQIPSNARRLRHSDFLSSFSLNPDESISVYIRIASKSSMQLPTKLWTETSYKEHNHRNSVIIGALLGVIFAIAAYHLLIYFSILEPVYLYYGFFMAGTALTFACMNGLPGFFLWPERNSEADNMLLLGLFTCSAFNCLFARGVVDTPERTPRMNLLLNLCITISAAGVMLMPVLPYETLLKLSLFTGLWAIVLVVTIFIITSLQRYQPAYYALIGSIIAGLGTSITMLDKMGVIPGNALNSQAVYIGFTLMTLVQAFALSYRIKVASDAHEKAQEELLITQKAMNSELDTMVRQRTEELEEVNSRLLKLSRIDGLTSLHNRRYFDDSLEREYRNAFRNKLPLGILILDIDHFKAVNDNYGHPFGDLCLKEIGTIVKENVRRPADIAARYGGEEFVVLLPNTNLEGTLHIANLIRDKVKAHSFKDEVHDIKLTISMGAISEIPEPGEEAASMIDRADKLLYQAKNNGRDQICLNME